MVGGVAAGLAAKSGWDVTVIRTVFVLAGLVSGFGAAPYVLAWLLVPAARGEPGHREHRGHRPARHRAGRRPGLAARADPAHRVLGGRLLARPAGLAAGHHGPALVLIWRNAPPAEQAVLQRFTQPLVGLADGHQRSRLACRMVIALVLAGGGIGILLAVGHKGAPAAAAHRRPGAGHRRRSCVVLGPWWLRIARDLVVERQARARAEERADMAARVHDSVLQTLALIQRRASRPAAGHPAGPGAGARAALVAVRRPRAGLARGRGPDAGRRSAADPAGGRGPARDSRRGRHWSGTASWTMTSGRCWPPGREATVNAAKWSGATVVSVFAEVEPDAGVAVRAGPGPGFDPDAVPADRKGLAQSVHARMARRGGTATVRSAPGEGTEVSLRMPRAAGKPASRWRHDARRGRGGRRPADGHHRRRSRPVPVRASARSWATRSRSSARPTTCSRPSS